MASTIKVNNVQASDGGNIINQCGTTITLGASGDTISLASGASQSGFGRSGSVNWQTGSIKTGTFSATDGEGYFVDTSSGSATMNLPAGSAGAIVAVADYTRTFQNNSLSVAPNGSEKIGGVAAAADLDVEGQSATFVYVDGTEGWINVQETQVSVTGLEPYICASVTGACNAITTSGDYKIATFVNPGNFVVGSAGTAAPCSGTGSNTFDYLVVAGGGGGGTDGGGGGGAGGYRESAGTGNGAYTVSPLGACVAALTLSPGTTYPVTVGGGGATSAAPPSTGVLGSDGDSSTFDTITSAGGGGGGGAAPAIGATTNGVPGGSGGGGSWDIPGTNTASTGGTGNTPPTSPPQGNNGGYGRHNGPTHATPGGGGGATQVGSNEGSGGPAGYGTGNGGDGGTSSINATPTARAGGGGGDTSYGGCGGTGGGGNRKTNGTANTGGGGGGGSKTPSNPSAGSGGSGIVIIRYKFQN